MFYQQIDEDLKNRSNRTTYLYKSVWLTVSDNGFACHSGRCQKTPVRENSTASLHGINYGSKHVFHVRCKPEEIRPGGTW